MPIGDEPVRKDDPFALTRSVGSNKGRKNAPQHLRDMRRVYKHPESPDETASQKAMRKLMTDDFTKFIGMLQQSERAHEASKAKRVAPDAVSPAGESSVAEEDEGTESARIVILRCLEDAGASRRVV